MNESSVAQRAAFERDGFVAVRGFLNAAELARLRAALQTFIADVVPGLARGQVYYENQDDPASLKQIQRLSEHDEHFAGLFRGRVKDLAERLLGEPVSGQNMQYFDKPPGANSATPAHQDGYYFMLEPCSAVTLWLALDAADEGNGCVRYLRGSHRLGLRQHGRTTTLGFSQSIRDFGSEQDRAAEVALRAAPGDILAHHALTIHRAGRNESAERSRRALGFIYYAQSARHDRRAHGEYQRRLAAELKQQGKI